MEDEYLRKLQWFWNWADRPNLMLTFHLTSRDLCLSQQSGVVGFLLPWVWRSARGLHGSYSLWAVCCGMEVYPGSLISEWQEQPEEVLIFAEDRSICAQVARTGYQSPTTHLYLCKSSDQSSVISLWEHPCSQPPSSMAHWDNMALTFWSASSAYWVFIYCAAFGLTGLSLEAPITAGSPWLRLAISFLAKPSAADSASRLGGSFPISPSPCWLHPNAQRQLPLASQGTQAEVSTLPSPAFPPQASRALWLSGSHYRLQPESGNQPPGVWRPSSSCSGTLWLILRMVLLVSAVLSLLCTGIGNVGMWAVPSVLKWSPRTDSN